MNKSKSEGVLLALLLCLLVSVRSPRACNKTEEPTMKEMSQNSSLFLQQQQDDDIQESNFFGIIIRLEYEFFTDSCRDAENIVRSTMARIFSQHSYVPAALLRLLFHDCFIMGCDASVFLDDSNGKTNHSTERQAVPNRTLKGFEQIDLIKEELEKACPAVVSCTDTLALATRDGILLKGGPYYQVSNGRRDSLHSYFKEALAGIRRPDGNINQTLHLFSLKGFNERKTVSLLGGHDIGKISCQFLQGRLNNFLGTGRPDPTMAADFLNELRQSCQGSSSNSGGLSSSISSARGGLDTHYFQGLLKGRGLLFADQRIATIVRTYASDEATFRTDFARAMVKLSGLDVLTVSQGQVRINCSWSVKTS